MSGTKRSMVGSWGKRTAVMGASCREARAGVRRVRAFSSSLARDPNDLTCAPSPEPRHGSLAADNSASRAQPAPAHLGGAKKKVVGRALLTWSVKEYTGTHMPPHGHSRAAVCAKVGLQPRQVIDCAEKRVVRPQVADPLGGGETPQYSHDNQPAVLLATPSVDLRQH